MVMECMVLATELETSKSLAEILVNLTLLVDNTGDQAGLVSLDGTGDKTDLMPGENPNLKEQEFENPWKLYVSEAFLGEKLLSRAP